MIGTNINDSCNITILMRNQILHLVKPEVCEYEIFPQSNKKLRLLIIIKTNKVCLDCHETLFYLYIFFLENDYESKILLSSSIQAISVSL